MAALKPRPRIVRLAYATGMAAASLLLAGAGWEVVGRQVGSSRTPSALFAGFAGLHAVGGVNVSPAERPMIAPARAGATRLAVLPFENLGSKEDDYFADGITDEVRGKLAKLPGLEIIARTSSNGYRKTEKTPQEIGKELNAEYLLTGAVRFAKGSDGTRRVQVSPELSLASSGASRWAQPFDATLTDVFQVQGEIATRVAQALDVALSAGEKRSLEATSTQNLSAYEAYLRGEEASQAMAAADPPSLRRAIGHYEQAVALDPRFVEAWASLSRASSFLYGNGAPMAAAAERAREAAEKALALGPERPEGHQALGDYYRIVIKDAARALPEMYQARRLSPGRADYATSLALTRQYLGQWEASLGDLEEAQRLDPRSVNTLRRLGFATLRLHRTSESRKAYDRGLALAPTNLSLLREKAMTYLAEGDLAGARAVLKAAPREVDQTALVAFVANSDLVWVFDEAQRDLLVRLTPSAFDENRGVWALCLARAFALKRDEPNVRKYAEIARAEFEKQLEAVPTDAQPHTHLGLSLAYLGRKAEAIREAERAVELLADLQGCSHRPLRPAPARARLHPHRRERKGARQAGAAAEDPVPPHARVARDRPQLRPAPAEPAIQEVYRVRAPHKLRRHRDGWCTQPGWPPPRFCLQEHAGTARFSPRASVRASATTIPCCGTSRRSASPSS